MSIPFAVLLKKQGWTSSTRTTVGPSADQTAAPSEASLALEFLATLNEARDAVRAEVASLARAPFLDAATLHQSEKATTELAGLARSLANAMRDHGAQSDLITEVEALGQFFLSMTDQIASLHLAAQEASSVVRAQRPMAEPPTYEALRTLRVARAALQGELDQCASQLLPDKAFLQQLGSSAAALAQQADVLAIEMVDRRAEDAKVREAEKLAAFFRAVVDRVADWIDMAPE